MGDEAQSPSYMDIIEIDAASNRRIDEIRDLRDKVNTAPSAAKYKVYIIDEVHMLTKEAFNALLKTLEEPPAHVVFILATTEAHKLPETIVSRTQRYTFRPVSADKVVSHLQTIAKAEKISIDKGALELIAEHGDGSFRDSISLLDQASNITDTITRPDVEQMLGLVSAEQIGTLLQAVVSGDKTAVVANLAELHSAGYEPARIASQLGEQLRTTLLNATAGLDSHETLHLLELLLNVPAARQPKQLLELVLLQTTLRGEVITLKPATAAPETIEPLKPTAAPEPKPAPSTVIPAEAASKTEKSSMNKPEDLSTPADASGRDDTETVSVKTHSNPAETATQVDESAKAKKPTPKEGALSDVELNDIWYQTLDSIKKQYNTLYGMARMATPELAGDKLTLNLKFAFHQKRLNEAKNRKILGDAFSSLSGKQIEIYCVVADKPLPPVPVAAASGDVSAISNIFGGAELLES